MKKKSRSKFMKWQEPTAVVSDCRLWCLQFQPIVANLYLFIYSRICPIWYIVNDTAASVGDEKEYYFQASVAGNQDLLVLILNYFVVFFMALSDSCALFVSISQVALPVETTTRTCFLQYCFLIGSCSFLFQWSS